MSKTAHTPTPWFAMGAGVFSEDPKAHKPGTPLQMIAATGEDDGDSYPAGFIAHAATHHDALIGALQGDVAILGALLEWIDRGLTTATFGATGAAIRADIDKRLQATRAVLMLAEGT